MSSAPSATDVRGRIGFLTLSSARQFLAPRVSKGKGTFQEASHRVLDALLRDRWLKSNAGEAIEASYQPGHSLWQHTCPRMNGRWLPDTRFSAHEMRFHERYRLIRIGDGLFQRENGVALNCDTCEGVL